MHPPSSLRPPSNRDPARVPLGYESFAGDKQFATTLARGIELLRCFTPREPVLGNKELAERTGLPRSTVSRLTYTLMVLGHLRASPRYGKYQLGSALVSTAYPLLASIGLRQAARPRMTELAEATGGSVSMGIRDRLDVVLVETGRSRATVHASLADTGLTLPIAGSAIGRAYLAGCEPAVREGLINEIRVKTPADWTRYGAGVRDALAAWPRLGYCVVDGKLLADVQAVGVPFGRGADGELIVFNCSFQGRRAPAAWLHETIAPKLMAMVRALRQDEAER
jgi:DNA-binding IclR family transcriptional regulator